MAEKRVRGNDDDDGADESESLGEMDGTKLMGVVIDSIDEALFNEGLVFKDNMNWEEFGEELRDLLFRYYDDEDNDDGSFDPAAPAPTSSEEEEEVEVEDEK